MKDSLYMNWEIESNDEDFIRFVETSHYGIIYSLTFDKKRCLYSLEATQFICKVNMENAQREESNNDIKWGDHYGYWQERAVYIDINLTKFILDALQAIKNGENVSLNPPQVVYHKDS